MSLKCGGNVFSQGTNITTTPDVNIKSLEISTKAHPQQPGHNGTTRRQNCKIPCPIKCSIECTKKSRRPSSARSESVSKCSSPTGSSVRSEPVGCTCKKPKIHVNTMPEGPTTPICLCRPPPTKRICKCSGNELEFEREKRKKLEEEVEILKRQISELMQSKCLAVTMTQQLRRKYDRFRGLHGDAVSKLSEVSKENEYLCKCLEHERARNAKKYNTGDTSVQVDEKRRGRLDTIQEQEEEIKTLNESLMSLTKSVQEKEIENKRLQTDKQQLSDKLKSQKVINKRLSDSNGRLAKSVQQKHDSFVALRTKAGKIEKNIKDYKEEARRSQMEIEHLNDELQKQQQQQQQLKEKMPKIPSEVLEEKLKKTKDRERRASETIQLLNQKVRDMQNKENTFKLKEQEFQKVLKEQKTLQAKYDEVVQKLTKCEEAEKKRSQNIQSKMQNFSEDMAEKELRLKTEKDEMKNLINELTEIVRQQKARIEELQSVTERQEMVIRSQTESISSHEEQFILAEKETELMKQKYSNLDSQLEKIKATFGDDIGANGERLVEKIVYMNQELKEMRSTLDDEKARSSIKDKLIEDQYATIENLKKTIKGKEKEVKAAREEVRRSSQEIQKSSQELATMARALEREEAMKRTVAGDLTNMQRHRDVLEKKVSLLETTIEKLSVSEKAESLKDSFEVQKQEWDVERKELQLERDRAIEAAKYATQTLIEAMDDFQGQIKSQQQLQRLMTDLICYKDRDKVAPCMRSTYDPKRVMKSAVKRHETQFQQDFTRIHDKQMYCPGIMGYHTCPDDERYYSAYSSEPSEQQAAMYPRQFQQQPAQPYSGPSHPQPYLYPCPSKCMRQGRCSSPACYCGMTPCCCKHKHNR